MSQAARQFEKAIGTGRFKALAQKLAQHIEHLSEDPLTRVRWLWELIQNGKDCPNQFQKVHIQITVRDDKMTFKHNGDPFRVSDLQSLVSQYSSKEEENKMNQETTGKYGTGFITTYILSRKIKIRGLVQLIKEKVQESDPEEEKDQGTDSDHSATKNQLNNSQKGLSSMDETEKQTNKRVKTQSRQDISCSYVSIAESQPSIKQKRIIHSKQVSASKSGTDSEEEEEEGQLCYLDFSIVLDRTYENRNELEAKLKKTEKVLMQKLEGKEMKPAWVRQQDHLDTVFTYLDLDQAAFAMIDSAVATLRELFGYCLLFNPKLFRLEVKDKRASPKFRNIVFQKKESSHIGDLDIFNCLFLEEGKQPQTISYAFIESRDHHETVAMPINVHDGDIELLAIKQNMPKMFKEFPLIGCPETEFNFAFTSRKFYPNEKRSDLLLNTIQGRSEFKRDENWAAIETIFGEALKLLTKITKLVRRGQENTLIAANVNSFSHFPEFDRRKMQSHYSRITEHICDAPVFQTNFSMSSLRNLVYILTKTGEQQNQKAFSLAMNRHFPLMYPQAACSDLHQRLYPFLTKKGNIWSEKVQLKTEEDCLTCLQEYGFKFLTKFYYDSEKAIEWYRDLYVIFSEFAPNFLDQKKPGHSQKRFVLTNNLIEKSLHDQTDGLPLFIKSKDISSAHLKVALSLGLDLNAHFIHEDLAKYFLNVSIYDLDHIFNDYRKLLALYLPHSRQKQLTKINDHIRFLLTFGAENNFITLIKKINAFQSLTPFDVGVKSIELKLPKEELNHHFQELKAKCLIYLTEILQQKPTLSVFMKTVLCPNASKEEAMKFLNEWEQFFPKVTYRLSWEEKFEQSVELSSYVCTSGKAIAYREYPSPEDIEFHKQMVAFWDSSRLRSKSFFDISPALRSLTSQLLHPKMDMRRQTTTNYTMLFGFAAAAYSTIEVQSNSDLKLFFLNYVTQIYRDFKENKSRQEEYIVFKKIIEKRHVEYLSILQGQYSEQEKDVFCRLFLKRSLISEIGEIMDCGVPMTQIRKFVGKQKKR